MVAQPRVLEVGRSVATGYCGRLLAMMGADVLRVDIVGDEEMTPRDEYLGCFKRSIEIDPTDDATPTVLDTLYAQADVVIRDHEGDPLPVLAHHKDLSGYNPKLVDVVISPFGLTGPYSHYHGNEFIDLAVSGHLYITGDPAREPLAAGGPWSGYGAGTIAAIGALAALRKAERTGRGRLLDIGRMEAMASLHQWSLILYTHQGYVKRRWGNRMAESYYPYSFFRCADGWICIGVVSPLQWEGFCLALDMAEFLLDMRYETSGDRFDRADELDEVICPKLEQMTVEQTVTKLQEHRVPAGPVLDVIETILDEQLTHRKFWAHLPHLGPDAKVPERPFHLEGEAPFRPAPRRGVRTAELLSEVPPGATLAAAKGRTVT